MRIVIIIVLAAVLLFAGCAKDNNAPEESVAGLVDVIDIGLRLRLLPSGLQGTAQ